MTTLPMTLDRVNKEVKAEKEDPTAVESLDEAFKKFKPELKFKGRAGEEETEFEADFVFQNIKDFDPENLQSRQSYKDEDGNVHYRRNDIAELKANIDLLYRLKDRWKLPAVRRAWNNPAKRKEIIQALGGLCQELQKVAGKEGEAS